MRLIGVTFFALAAYLTAESVHDLVTRVRPGAAALVIAALAVREGLEAWHGED